MAKVKKFAIGTAVALAAGYVAGILTAPKSGKETRKDIKNNSAKALRETEKLLKELYVELTDAMNTATSKAKSAGQKGSKEVSEMVDNAKAARTKVKEVLSAIREGNADDPDLKAAVKQAKESKEHLYKYIKKSEN